MDKHAYTFLPCPFESLKVLHTTLSAGCKWVNMPTPFNPAPLKVCKSFTPHFLQGVKQINKPTPESFYIFTEPGTAHEKKGNF